MRVVAPLRACTGVCGRTLCARGNLCQAAQACARVEQRRDPASSPSDVRFTSLVPPVSQCTWRSETPVTRNHIARLLGSKTMALATEPYAPCKDPDRHQLRTPADYLVRPVTVHKSVTQTIQRPLAPPRPQVYLPSLLRRRPVLVRSVLPGHTPPRRTLEGSAHLLQLSG
jgi:hypothetical protein